jgi:hypothetical protein
MKSVVDVVCPGYHQGYHGKNDCLHHFETSEESFPCFPPLQNPDWFCISYRDILYQRSLLQVFIAKSSFGHPSFEVTSAPLQLFCYTRTYNAPHSCFDSSSPVPSLYAFFIRSLFALLLIQQLSRKFETSSIDDCDHLKTFVSSGSSFVARISTLQLPPPSPATPNYCGTCSALYIYSYCCSLIYILR